MLQTIEDSRENVDKVRPETSTRIEEQTSLFNFQQHGLLLQKVTLLNKLIERKNRTLH